MKKEDVISAGIMTIVSMLVLIGFTVAWYTGVLDLATIGGMHLKAAELNNIKIALTEDGPDISTLEGAAKYVDIGLQDMDNVEVNKLAPGQFGKVTFYVTPSDEGIEYCEITPTVWIRSGDETAPWYPGEGTGEGDGTEGDGTENVTTVDLEKLYEITGRHIDFFSDEAMTRKLDEENPFYEAWEPEDGNKQKALTIYWKWYYEYPFTAEEENLSEAEREALINKYDAEDTQIGNNITAMKFHFSFSAQ